jgi:hypothetical protein
MVNSSHDIEEIRYPDVVVNYTRNRDNRQEPMKRPSWGFIGMMIGLASVLLVPSMNMNTAGALWYWLVILPATGVIIESIVRLILHRSA